MIPPPSKIPRFQYYRLIASTAVSVENGFIHFVIFKLLIQTQSKDFVLITNLLSLD